MGGPLGSETSIDILKTELSNHFKPANDPSDDADGSENGHLSSLCIKNKYFTAQIQIIPFHNNDNDNNDSVPDQKEDGILLIFPSTSIPITQIEYLTELHNSVPDAGDTLRLCISTSVGTQHKTAMTEKEYEEQYAQRVLWCLDLGYEYVEVDLSEEGLTGGFDVREKDGFARVVEAMGGTVWSSAVMTEAKVKARRNIMECVSAVQEPDVGVGAIAGADDVSTDVSTDDVADANHSETCKKEVKEQATDPSLEQTKNEEEKKDEASMAIIDDIEQVMKEAKIIRESARNSEMSDDERRQRAGDAAEMLMGLLDSMDFDEDGESESSDEE